MSLSRPAKATILASGQFLTTCVSLVCLAVLSRVFDLREYGTYRQVILAYGLAAPLLVLGLPQALYYFLPGEERSPRRILCENLLLLFVAGALFSAFLALGGNHLLAWVFRNPALAGALSVFAAYPLVAIPLRALEPCLMARDRPKHVALFNVGSRVLILGSVLAAGLWWRTVAATLLATLLASALSLVAGLALMFRACPGPLEPPGLAGVSRQLRFAVPLGVATLFGILSMKVGQAIVSAMCSPEEFAIYANGAIEIPLIGVITGSATAVLIPELTRYVKAGDRATALALWQRSMVKCSTILLPAMAFLLVCAPDVIEILFSAKYEGSVLPFRILLLILPLRAATFGAMFLAANANRLVMYRSAVDVVVGAVLCVLCVSLFGMQGAAAATVALLYLWTIPYSVFFIGRLYQAKVHHVLPLKRIGMVLAAALSAGAAVIPALLMLPQAPAWLRLLISTPLFALMALVGFAVFRVNEFEELIVAVLPARVAFVVQRFNSSLARALGR